MTSDDVERERGECCGHGSFGKRRNAGAIKKIQKTEKEEVGPSLIFSSVGRSAETSRNATFQSTPFLCSVAPLKGFLETLFG